MTEKRFFSLEGMTSSFFVGEISNEEMRKRDIRKALQITSLSMISSVLISIFVYLINFGI